MTPKTPPEKSSKPRMKHWTPTQNHNKQHTNIHALKPPFYHFFPMFHELLPLSLYLCTSSQVSWILCLDLLLRLLRLLRLRLGQSLGLTCTSRNQKRFHGLCLLHNCIQVWGFLSSKLNWRFIQGCTDLHHVALHGFVCASSSDLPRWTWKLAKFLSPILSVLIQHNSTDWSQFSQLWLGYDSCKSEIMLTCSLHPYSR